MAEPFLAEIRVFSFSYAPKGWATCNGQLMPINQNQALFSLLGTTYGGDGRTTFALPNLQGRTPMHMGDGYIEGQSGGEAVHTLSVSEMPPHNHIVNAVAPNDSSGNTNIPTGALFSNSAPAEVYTSGGVPTLSPVPQTITNAGQSQPHENRQPFLTLNFCIALQGVFPSRN